MIRAAGYCRRQISVSPSSAGPQLRQRADCGRLLCGIALHALAPASRRHPSPPPRPPSSPPPPPLPAHRNPAQQLRACYRLIAKMPTLAAMAYKTSIGQVGLLRCWHACTVVWCTSRVHAGPTSGPLLSMPSGPQDPLGSPTPTRPGMPPACPHLPSSLPTHLCPPPPPPTHTSVPPTTPPPPPGSPSSTPATTSTTPKTSCT